MSKEVTPTVETSDKSILDQIKDTVKDTIKAEAMATIDQLIETIKEKLTANGIEFTEQVQTLVKEAITAIMQETGETVSEKVDTFLDGKKAIWTELAATNPDEARRKLRNFWLGVAGVCAIVGFALGVWVF